MQPRHYTIHQRAGCSRRRDACSNLFEPGGLKWLALTNGTFWIGGMPVGSDLTSALTPVVKRDAELGVLSRHKVCLEYLEVSMPAKRTNPFGER